MNESISKLCAVAFRIGRALYTNAVGRIEVEDNDEFARLCVAIVKDFDKSTYYGYIDEFLDDVLDQEYIDTMLTTL